MSGKGSRQRPTDHQKFSDNYDRIFAKKKQKDYHAPVDDNTPVKQKGKTNHVPKV
jgi:hypothetical protein